MNISKLIIVCGDRKKATVGCIDTIITILNHEKYTIGNAPQTGDADNCF